MDVQHKEQSNKESVENPIFLDLDQLTLWSKAWNLHFNKDKCVILRISPKQSPTLFNYHISGDPLVIVSTDNVLGVLMSSNLSLVITL